jgi:hypothetical protein
MSTINFGMSAAFVSQCPSSVISLRP